MKDSVSRRFTVSGRVQGVYFRASTREIAQQLGVRGYARNLADGTVEVLAVGAHASLDALEKWLWSGSPASRVDAVQAEPISEPESLDVPDHFATR